MEYKSLNIEQHIRVNCAENENRNNAENLKRAQYQRASGSLALHPS
jgi:hypothetical protein